MVDTQRNVYGNDLQGRVWVDAPEHLGGQRAYVRSEDAETVRTVWTDLQPAEGESSALALIEALQGQVPAATLHALRAQLVPTSVSPLVHKARTGEAKVILSFAGQAQSYFDDLERLYEIPNARRLIRICADALKNEVDTRAAFEGYHPHGLNLVQWIEDPSSRPEPVVLSESVISQPLIFVAQCAQFVAMERLGFASDTIAEWAVATTGHSQGILTAMLAAEGLRFEPLAERAAKIACYLVWQGIHMQASYGRAPGHDRPMVAVTGQTRQEVEAAIEGVDAVISLANAPRRYVLSGKPSELERAVDRLKAKSKAETSAFDNGQGPRPRPLGVEWLSVSAPFHSPAMADALPMMHASMRRLGFETKPEDLVVPMLRFENGAVWTGEDLAASQSINSVDWPATMRGALAFQPTHIIDAGPGAGVSAVSALCMRGHGVQVIPGATEAGETVLQSKVDSDLTPSAPWSIYAPTLVETPDGQTRLENEFTRRMKRPPIFLPGMTPTTVEAPIVAAAANAGYMAELAGGGQVSEKIFRERAAELRELLNPGEGYVVNTLFLDPYLWGLQIGKDRLVQKLRAEGHPILGVTITAGIPELDEALSLLNEFRSLGMNVNSLKVGNDDQIRQALAIADADEDGFILQVEGGKAGGHHSYDGLEEMLLTWYDRIRRRGHLLLTVGGGVGTQERVMELITGQWSVRHGRAPMPVDAVFLGTALMAAQEACTAPKVKQTLVDTVGTPAWVGRGSVAGGINSGLSGLGADIHYVDNHASQTGTFLDSIAGDEEQILAQKDRIVDALNRTAKPYFGDLDRMTYADVLSRLIEVMALGRDGRYEDGIWLDVTHRARYGRMLRRALQRCAYTDALPGDSTLNAPAQQLKALKAGCPLLTSTTITPEDIQYFIHKVCATPGKPVPFVPVIDANVRRWYKSDSLWQAHDDRYEPDQCLIIPGPEAVTGIEKANVPVADLLEFYLRDTVEAAIPGGRLDTPDLVQVALNASVCLFGDEDGVNPLPAILAASPETAELTATSTGVRLKIVHQLPLHGEETLRLDFAVEPWHPCPVRAPADLSNQMRRFYQRIMPDEVAIDQERVAAYRRVTADDGPGHPEQIFFATALPAMMSVLLDKRLGLDPLSLLHLRSEIRQVADIDGPYTVQTEAPRVNDEPNGRRVRIDAHVLSGKTPVAELRQEFFIRNFTGVIPQAWQNQGDETESIQNESALSRPRQLFTVDQNAPTDLRAFAHISGDLNPIHRDPALAALAGLPCPIVHGQWTAATACALVCGLGRRLKHSEARFLAPVMPGAQLTFTANVVARIEGDDIVEVDVSAGPTPVTQLRLRVEGQKTALIFPGQGSQRRGMGMDSYERSKAARDVWERADKHTRAQYGFSLLDIVRSNPKTLDVGGTVVRHPEGVLNVTQFTQVALTVLSCAGVAELRESGACSDDNWFCGHSVGEYSALSAVTDVLSLQSLIDVTYHRGLTMQRYVDRDENGRSDYAMGVIRPHRARIDGSIANELVESVADDTGLPLYVVNHNVLNRQYAVAGHLDAIAVLEAKLLAKAPDGSAWVRIPGIDVPFHSPLLVAGVPAFRDVLEKCIPKDVDIDRLVDRYIPNLVARPFELSDDFIDDMIAATGYAELQKFKKNPRKNARKILIELLAWQFASPVRWIETQEYLADTVEQLVEIGPGSAPVLCNMFLSSTRHRERIPHVLHAERDFDDVLGMGAEAEEAPAETVASAEPVATAPAAAVPQPVAVAVPTAAAAGPIEDEEWGVQDSLKAILALRVGRAPDAISDSETIDGLLGGNSARRNQLLLDIGKEYGVGAVDGAHELPLLELVEALDRAGGARYRHPGAILKAAQTQALSTLGVTKKTVMTRLSADFGLESGRAEAVLSTLGVELDTYTADADPVKAAATAYARRAGISLERSTATTGAAVSVDAGALKEVEDAHRESWLSIARKALEAGGLDPFLVDHALTAEETPVVVKPTVQKGRFEESRHVAFTAVDQWSRADALRWYQGLKQGEKNTELSAQIARSLNRDALGLFDYFLSCHGPRTAIAKSIKSCRSETEKSLSKDLSWAGHTALVTGAGPDSIAESVVVQLLEGGARVIVTTSRPTRKRVQRFKGLYRRHAARGAELHIVPFDQGNFEDIDALCEWLLASRFETRGTERVELKGPWRPTLCFPFGAVPAEGDPTTLDADIAATLQVNLIGVEKLIGRLAKGMGETGKDTPAVHVVLPLSPNHGQMGRDGLYAESKIGLETLLRRWQAEYEQWGQYTTICGAKIGWVRGTGLMHGLDRVYQTIEEEMGIDTYTPDQMAALLLSHCTDAARRKASKTPQVADLTGGFGKAKGLREMINQALSDAQSALGGVENVDATTGLPLNTYAFPQLPEALNTQGLDARDCVAIVGYGEIGPFGNARARWAMETSGTLSMEASVELAWLCGHIKFEAGEWVDVESGEPVDTSRLAEEYDLEAGIGIRENETFDPNTVESYTEVLLSEDMVFHVPDAALAEMFRRQDPEHTDVINEGDGCRVVRRAGCKVRVPRIDALDRDIAGQLPTGFDATRLGFDTQQLDQIDPVAIYNLLATAEAFRTMGTEPEDLWTHVHPARIACTQGSGIGGMRAQHRLYADAALGQNTQSDVLQETLINVGAAYPGMYIYGGYGPMINPVSACATAAVSVEIGADLIRTGKADFAVAGAFDDFSVEGVRGFAEMQATISAEERTAKGLEPNQSSRPCDDRRGGFVEAQGGGTILLCRADKAVAMGLPIYGLVVGAWSAADGIQRSVPAPGPGLAAIAAGGMASPLGEALTRHGLSADDVGVVSMHGTSTNANDLNETELHARIARSLGRSEGHALPVIAQKALTGHSKGGAAAWQLIGMCQAMADGIVPPMRNLDEPDRRLNDRNPLVFSDEAIPYGPGELRAGLLTSLGFGHVGAALCIAHPNVLLETLSEGELSEYAHRRDARWMNQVQAQYSVLMGEHEYIQVRDQKPVSGSAEYAFLLSANEAE